MTTTTTRETITREEFIGLTDGTTLTIRTHPGENAQMGIWTKQGDALVHDSGATLSPDMAREWFEQSLVQVGRPTMEAGMNLAPLELFTSCPIGTVISASPDDATGYCKGENGTFNNHRGSDFTNHDRCQSVGHASSAFFNGSSSSYAYRYVPGGTVEPEPDPITPGECTLGQWYVRVGTPEDRYLCIVTDGGEWAVHFIRLSQHDGEWYWRTTAGYSRDSRHRFRPAEAPAMSGEPTRGLREALRIGTFGPSAESARLTEELRSVRQDLDTLQSEYNDLRQRSLRDFDVHVGVEGVYTLDGPAAERLIHEGRDADVENSIDIDFSVGVNITVNATDAEAAEQAISRADVEQAMRDAGYTFSRIEEWDVGEVREA